MDKNAIKKYAVWARRELIEKVSQKALQYGIEEGKELDPKLDSINGVLLSDVEKKQRQALIRKIKEDGYAQVMEEVAYTWFNRFIALRFMEVNGYLPSHVRVFTDEAGGFNPQIMSEALHLELKCIDKDKIYELKNNNKDDELFKYLLITQCNDLYDIFPKMFQKISDYTELLLPDYLLREGSVIEQMVNQKEGIPEADWQDQVQIIGWLYQYYNTEPKEKVFADLKKNVKISKETIPAATQLFTPDWIVHYMVENSLGRLWIEGHPNDSLKSEWKYYLDEAVQEPDVQKQLEKIRKEYVGLKPEEIKCIDPCMGSGHILCVLFDTLVKIYEEYGYSARDAAASIVENNLWGLDIDERAAQLAYFAVIMKARQYDRRFLSRGIQPHVYAIEESNGLKYDGDYGDFLLDKQQQETLSYMFDIFNDAKEYGSILKVDNRDYDSFINAWKLTAEQTLTDVRMMGWFMYAGDKIDTLAYQAKALSQKYHVVVTNPPYMGLSNMSAKLQNYIKKHYSNSKNDFFSVFIERCGLLLDKAGMQGMITQHAWMFLSSFEKIRLKILEQPIVTMAHLGARAFEEIGGEVVQTTSFVLRNCRIPEYTGVFDRLIDPTTQDGKEKSFLMGNNRYSAKQTKFLSIPGSPVAYWVSDSFVSLYKNNRLNDFGQSRKGMATGLNAEFVRYWFEVDHRKIGYVNSREDASSSTFKWFPYANGGEYRKWFGNNLYVVNWERDGYRLQNEKTVDGSRIRAVNLNLDYIFKEGFVWTSITSSGNSFRMFSKGLFSSASNAWFPDNVEYLPAAIAFVNSKLVEELLKLTNPTLNANPNDIGNLPISEELLKNKTICELAKECIEISKNDWDQFEISQNFLMHPLIGKNKTIKQSFEKWNEDCSNRFNRLEYLEDKLNRIFIEAYDLQTEINPMPEARTICVRKADLSRDIKGLISYAVGCMFGRYSLDQKGLIFAGGILDNSKYKSFIPDEDGIIPICDDEYFEDDIVGRFIDFISVVYGDDNLEENLKFIADSLGGKGTPREILRRYFINDFYSDHVKMYQKRPIYWLFDSGKKNGFKSLIYMHRYQSDTIARIRTDYVHEQQSRYRTAIEDLSQRVSNVNESEKVKINRQLQVLKEQDDEVRQYEEKIHHLADQMIMIDLDAGVKENYEVFKDVLAKI